MRPNPILVMLPFLPVLLFSACGGGGGGAGGTPPALTAVSPAAGSGAGGEVVALTGSGFLAGVSEVRFGGAAAADVTVVDDTRLTCRLPASAPGRQDVAVTTSGGSALLPNGFRFRGPLGGEYGYFRFEGLSLSSVMTTRSDPVRVTWGAAQADADTGAIETALAVAESSLLSLGLERPVFDYASLPDARLSVGDYRGGISDGPGADVAVLGSTTGYPGLAVLVSRSGGTVSDAASVPATLAGDYTIAIFLHDGTASTQALVWGTLTLDGASAATNVQLGSNRGGAVIPVTPVPDGTYVVGTDRDVGLTLSGTSLTGVFLGAGELIVLGGATVASSDLQAIAILVPRATAATDATLAGTYHFASMASLRTPSSTPGGPHFESLTGTLTSDGAGALTAFGAGVSNRDGDVDSLPASAPSPPTPYQVTSDGSILLGRTLAPVGVVAPDGRFGLFLGTVAGRAPDLAFLVRSR